jgi:hypothetical protein
VTTRWVEDVLGCLAVTSVAALLFTLFVFGMIRLVPALVRAMLPFLSISGLA